MEDFFFALLGLALAVWLLSGPFLALRARQVARQAAAEVATLRERVAALEALAGVAPKAAAETAPEPVAEPLAEAAEAASPELVLSESDPVPESHSKPPSMESKLAQRWLVWLGGVALALGGLFVAAWAIEEGFLGPTARVAIAVALGLGLVYLADRSKRSVDAKPTEVPDYVSPALAAGGICTLFGATLAAHVLYQLISAAIGMSLLALISALAVGLAFRFGAFLALLGSIGAFVAPLVVDSTEPAPWALMIYLSVVVASLALVARLRQWWWLGLATLVGSTFWLALGIALDEDAPGAIAQHALLLGLAGILLSAAEEVTVSATGWRRWLGLRAIGYAGIVVACVALVSLLVVSAHATSAVLALALLSAIVSLQAYRRQKDAALAGIVAAADLAAAFLLAIPRNSEGPELLREPALALDPLFWISPDAAPLASGLAIIALAYGTLGFVAVWREVRPIFWSSLSVVVPLVALAIGYARLAGLEVSPGFAALALGLALIFTGLSERCSRRETLHPATGIYAVGAVSAVTLGAAMALEDAWLTTALAVELPILAWMAARMNLPILRRPALVIGLLVLGRVLLDPELTGSAPSLDLLLYTHAVPFIAFAIAAWLFRPSGTGGLVELLEVAALLFWLLMVTGIIKLAIRSDGSGGWLGSAMLIPSMLAWLLTGLALWRLTGRAGRGRLLGLAGHIVLLGGLLQLLVLILPQNPALTGEPIGSLPILNLLLPAYLAPAAIAAWVARLALTDRLMAPGALVRPELAGRLAGIAALGLFFLWLTLEVRHAYQGSVLTGATSQREWLAYSVAWLGLAAALLLAGVWWQRRPLRQAALAVGCIAILKAFLFDLSELEGLYRAASFLGLGLCLIGVGWLYQRFVVAEDEKARG